MQDLSQEEWTVKSTDDPNGIILDVRREEELEEGFIPRAINYDFMGGAAFIEQLNGLDKTKYYYVYCRSGNRSAQACELMEQLGFDKTYNLLGGFQEWEGEVEEL